jgi:hypothetical protein
MSAKKTIAQELEERLFYLADPDVTWVRGNPQRSGQACMVHDGVGGHLAAISALSLPARAWLRNFMLDVEDELPTQFNDHHAKSRWNVLERLEEAVDQARWEGV